MRKVLILPLVLLGSLAWVPAASANSNAVSVRHENGVSVYRPHPTVDITSARKSAARKDALKAQEKRAEQTARLEAKRIANENARFNALQNSLDTLIAQTAKPAAPRRRLYFGNPRFFGQNGFYGNSNFSNIRGPLNAGPAPTPTTLTLLR